LISHPVALLEGTYKMTNGDRFSFAAVGGRSDIQQEYVFKVSLVAVVRVRAQNESLAREVVPSILGSPSTDEVRLANEADFVMGKDATIIAVDFSVEEGSAKLVEVDGKTVNP
jgi:hypothetical protein